MTPKISSKSKTAKNYRDRKGFEKMCFSVYPVISADIPEKNRSESRVSPLRPENKFPSESPFCRTMTIGKAVLDNDSTCTRKNTELKEKKSKQTNQQSEESSSPVICRSEKLAIGRNQSFPATNSSHSSSMKQRILRSENMICGSKLVRLVSDSLTMKRSSSSRSRSTSESFSYDSSAISTVPSRSSTALSGRSCYHPSGHWAFGMILIVSIILSTFSTSSTVMCVPLGHQTLGNDEGVPSSLSSSSQSESNRRSGGAAAMIMSNSRLMELDRKPSPLEDDSTPSAYSLKNNGQLYLSSLLSNGPVKASALASSTDYSTGGFGRRGIIGSEEEEDQKSSSRHPLRNFSLERLPVVAEQNPSSQNTAPIQKLLPVDLVRSVGETRDDFDDDSNAPSSSLSEAMFGVNKGDENDISDDDRPSTGDQSEWETVIDPHLYVLTEWNTQPYQEEFPLLHQQRKRRNSGTGPSLSIVNPLDVLRQRLLLEIARRRMRQSHNQIIANEEILRKIGRRRR